MERKGKGRVKLNEGMKDKGRNGGLWQLRRGKVKMAIRKKKEKQWDKEVDGKERIIRTKVEKGERYGKIQKGSVKE
jgi:hypothetical protein